MHPLAPKGEVQSLPSQLQIHQTANSIHLAEKGRPACLGGEALLREEAVGNNKKWQPECEILPLASGKWQ